MKNTLRIFGRYFRLVLPFLWKDSRCLLSTLATFLLTCVDTVVVPLGPWLFSELVRRYAQEDWRYVWYVTILLTLCWLLGKTVRRLRGMVFFHVVNKAIASIRMRLITHFHHVALRGGASYDVNEVLSASTRVSLSVRFCLRTAFFSFIPTIGKLVACGLMMYRAFGPSKYFLGAVLATYLYVFFALYRFAKVRHKMWGQSDRVMVAMGESLRHRDFAKMHPEVERKRLDSLFEKERQGWWRENIVNNRIHLVQNLLFFSVTGLFFLYCMHLLQLGVLDVPTLVLLKGYIFVVYKQVFSLTEYMRGSCGYIVDMRKVLDMLSMRTEEAEGREVNEVAWKQDAPMVQLEKVTLRYDQGQHPVLSDVSLVINKGDKVVITGPSGCGKSTLARLLAGIYLPDEGRVLYKGVPTNTLPPGVIGRSLFFIGQDEPLMRGSIQANLMVEKGGDAAPLHYLGEGMHKEEVGRRFSGGERQRILLARCLSYRPEVVILDEAFSYLDEESGRMLFEMVCSKVPTVIVMTHRQEFFDRADRFYRLVGGALLG